MHSTTQGPPGPRDGAGRERNPAQAQQLDETTRYQDTAWLTSAQSVSWWDVAEFVAPMLARVGSWPMAGTPAWCALPDDDMAKWAALLDAAQHHALRVEVAQEAECAASQTVSAVTDWGAMGRQMQDRQAFFTANPWLRRVTP